MPDKKRILITAGGTGGHLFPAQALARDLLQEKNIEVLFVGGGLSTNRCFNKESFAFKEIFSATPYLSNISSIFKSLKIIAKGVMQSFKILSSFKPCLVVGFGSYHAFPILVAAVIKRVPIILFEPDSYPGKVNRLFSKWAKVNTVQFSQAAKHMQGNTVEVNMPVWKKTDETQVTVEEARSYFCLDPSKKTFLVFGGSQGASAINRFFCDAASFFNEKERDFQVIHLTGKAVSAEEARAVYTRLGITACVKEFEHSMHLAWKAASLVICRSGAASLAELAAFEVPGILIPFPYATNDHQKKNALFMENQVGGAVHLNESELSAQKLYTCIQNLVDPSQQNLEKMREKIRHFKTQGTKQNLSTIILKNI